MKLRILILLALLVAVPVSAYAADDASQVLGTLWMQTSAEYRAICDEVYNNATHCVAQRVHLANYAHDAQGRLIQTCLIGSHPVQKPVAVVMDLDETVIDNSGFQVYLLQHHLHYSPAVWAKWVDYQSTHPSTLRSVPGAIAFIHAAQKMGVTIVYISDRSAAANVLDENVKILTGLGVGTPDLRSRLYFDLGKGERPATLALMKKLGIGENSVMGRELLDTQGKKQRRRLEVCLRYDVIAYFGDNLYDYPVSVPSKTAPGQAAIQTRYAQVDRNAAHWGTNWFMPPNPVYGSFQPGAALPRQNLLPVLDDRGFGAYMKTSGH